MSYPDNSRAFVGYDQWKTTDPRDYEQEYEPEPDEGPTCDIKGCNKEATDACDTCGAEFCDDHIKHGIENDVAYLPSICTRCEAKLQRPTPEQMGEEKDPWPENAEIEAPNLASDCPDADPEGQGWDYDGELRRAALDHKGRP